MSIINDEEKLLLAKTDDLMRLCDTAGVPKFMGFLDEMSAASVRLYLQKRCDNFLFYGGFDEAERVMLGVFPDWCDDKRNDLFPIRAVTFTYRRGSPISHRDVLGSLMALRITRASVGDILTGDGRAVAFLTEQAAALVLREMDKIGGTGVQAAEGFDEPLPAAFQLVDASATVPSARLDAVVAALAAVGRGEAVRLIESGLVCVNALTCEKITKQVCAGDVLKIRGKGKFMISSACDFTRKQRIILKYKKYS